MTELGEWEIIDDDGQRKVVPIDAALVSKLISQIEKLEALVKSKETQVDFEVAAGQRRYREVIDAWKKDRDEVLSLSDMYKAQRDIMVDQIAELEEMNAALDSNYQTELLRGRILYKNAEAMQTGLAETRAKLDNAEARVHKLRDALTDKLVYGYGHRTEPLTFHALCWGCSESEKARDAEDSMDAIALRLKHKPECPLYDPS